MTHGVARAGVPLLSARGKRVFRPYDVDYESLFVSQFSTRASILILQCAKYLIFVKREDIALIIRDTTRPYYSTSATGDSNEMRYDLRDPLDSGQDHGTFPRSVCVSSDFRLSLKDDETHRTIAAGLFYITRNHF